MLVLELQTWFVETNMSSEEPAKTVVLMLLRDSSWNVSTDREWEPDWLDLWTQSKYTQGDCECKQAKCA